MSKKLDALVAKRVMSMSRIQNYSRDISCAWSVVEKILEWRDDVRFMALYGCAYGPAVRFFVVATGADIALCHGKTLPMAICVAALRAVGVSEDEIEEAMR